MIQVCASEEDATCEDLGLPSMGTASPAPITPAVDVESDTTELAETDATATETATTQAPNFITAMTPENVGELDGTQAPSATSLRSYSLVVVSAIVGWALCVFMEWLGRESNEFV